MSRALADARAAFAGQRWREAYTGLAMCAESGRLAAADHERMAVCAYLIGQDDDCVGAWETAHRAALEDGDHDLSARCAFWLALCLMLRGQMAPAQGWLARARRLIDEAGDECPASGYLLIPQVLGALHEGDPGAAGELALQAAEIGERFADADLCAFGALGHGQALIALGDAVAGSARLDEVMVSVTAGEVGPIASGIVYCAVILECMQLFDLQRASEWTAALSSWCEAQPDLVPYRGQCLVHRSQILMATGEWPGAGSSAEAARRRLSDPPHPALGAAYYQGAELSRLSGAFEEADRLYREAGRSGHDPMPGLALLLLARDDASGAAAAVRRALREAAAPIQRPALLAAAVEILRATGEVSEARAAADELASVAMGMPSKVLSAMAAHALGAVLLSEGDPAAALTQLRAAVAAWRSLRMPYEAARTTVLLGLACAALGDRTSASLELEAAREAFATLGARPDLDRVDTLSRGLGVTPGDDPTPSPGGLSHREREVLALVATGATNREIAGALAISQHTVSRHLENIFSKLGVTTRAAATAYAYEHHLLDAPG